MQEDFIKQIVHVVLLNPVMTRDHSPELQRDSSRDRLDAVRTEQRRNKFNKNRPISQEIFSPTQIILQSQSQSAAPFTQVSPVKPNPFQKSAEDRSAFLQAISRSPSPNRLQTPFTAMKQRERKGERGMRVTLDNKLEPPALKSLKIGKKEARDIRKASHNLMSCLVSDQTTVEREKCAERDSYSEK
jgi:hypothetical protein